MTLIVGIALVVLSIGSFVRLFPEGKLPSLSAPIGKATSSLE